MNEDLEILPAGAESWEVASDKVTWTFHIRKGLQWSDGVPVTAHDYAFQYQRMADPKTGFDYGWFFTDILNFGEIQKGEKPVSDLGVTALDDYTLQIVTTVPEPFFPQKTLMVRAVPKHVAEGEETPGAWAASPETCVSSGPFKLISWTKDKEMVFGVNPDYKGDYKPYLEKLVFLIGGSESVMPAYEANEIDANAYLGYSVTPADVAKGQVNPKESGLHFYTNFRTFYVPLDSTKPPFDDVRVRKAFAKAVDRDGLAASAVRDMGVPTYAMLPRGFHAANVDALKPYQQYDPEQAKKLMAEAGYPDGQGFPEVNIYNYVEWESIKSALEALRAGWKETLGVTVNINNVEAKVYGAGRSAKEFEMMFELYEFDYVDASNMLGLWAHNNRYSWTNDEFNALVDEADTTMGDDAKRVQLYQEAEKVLVDDVGAIFLYNEKRPQFWKPYIKGTSLEPNKDGTVAWRGNKLGLTPFTIYITKDVENYR